MRLTVAQLAERIGAELAGDGSGQINGVSGVETARETDVTFIKDRQHYGRRSGTLTDAKHIPGLEKSKAGAVIVCRRIKGLSKPQLIVKNVDAGLIESLHVFAPGLKGRTAGIDKSARVAINAKVDEGACVGANVVVDDGVEIGTGSIIESGCRIGQNSTIGKNCRLDSNVVVYHNCYVGNNVIIQANSTIGSVGFGYALIDGCHVLIPHNGGVVIEDCVEIGANCCIDRAKFGNTVIGAGTKIDNLVQIAHNVVIGKCCLIAGLVGIAGSCKLGDGVVLGGQVGLADNIEIGEGTIVGGQSGVTHSIAAGQQIMGKPATERKEALRIIGLTRRLPKLAEQCKQLSKRIEELEAAKDNKE